MMKRFIAMILVFCSLLWMAGCKEADENLGVTGGLGGSVNIGDDTIPSFEEEQEQNDAEPEKQPEQAPNAPEQTPQTPDQPTSPSEEEEEEETETTPEKNPYEVFQADTSGTVVKIMSQNLRIDSMDERGSDNDIRVRRHRFKWLVEKYDPDVIGLQEIDDTWLEVLPEDFGGKYTLHYFGRDNGGVGEGTPVMWKTAKYKKVRAGAFWLSKSPDAYSLSYDSGGPRIVNWVQLQDKETKVQFTVYSTHYGFYKSNDAYKGIYQQMVRAFNERPGYSFWMGDFNIGYKNKAYHTMVDQKKIIDLWDLSEAMKVDGHCTVGEFKKGSYNGFEKPEGSGVYGDFIWAQVNNHMAIDHYQYCYEMPAVEEKGVGAGYVSDHFAVYAEVRLDTKISYKDYYDLLKQNAQ